MLEEIKRKYKSYLRDELKPYLPYASKYDLGGTVNYAVLRMHGITTKEEYDFMGQYVDDDPFHSIGSKLCGWFRGMTQLGDKGSKSLLLQFDDLVDMVVETSCRYKTTPSVRNTLGDERVTNKSVSTQCNLSPTTKKFSATRQAENSTRFPSSDDDDRDTYNLKTRVSNVRISSCRNHDSQDYSNEFIPEMKNVENFTYVSRPVNLNVSLQNPATKGTTNRRVELEESTNNSGSESNSNDNDDNIDRYSVSENQNSNYDISNDHYSSNYSTTRNRSSSGSSSNNDERNDTNNYHNSRHYSESSLDDNYDSDY